MLTGMVPPSSEGKRETAPNWTMCLPSDKGTAVKSSSQSLTLTYRSQPSGTPNILRLGAVNPNCGEGTRIGIHVFNGLAVNEAVRFPHDVVGEVLRHRALGSCVSP